MLKLRNVLGLVASVGLVAVSAAAHADAVLTKPGAFYLGYIDDNIPSNPANETQNINGLNQLTIGGTIQDCPGGSVEMCDRVGSTLAGPFAAAVDDFAGKVTIGNSDPAKVTLTSTYQYILGKYDGPSAGAWVWYSQTGFTGVIEIPKYYLTDPNQLGLSHISYYNRISDDCTEPGGCGPDRVPEPGTIALVGLALTGMVAMRRRRKE